jgi:hypothetical protein
MFINLLKKQIKKLFLATPTTLNIINKKILNNDYTYNINSFGNLNKNKIFYVIRRSPGTGLFSNLTFVLNHMLIAKKFGFIPVVDMKNFITIYNEKNSIYDTKNAWEYYFKPISNYSLDEVYKSYKVVFCDNKFYNTFCYNIEKNDSMKKILQNEIKFNDKIYNEFKYIQKKNYKGKILGIHFRGTSYKSSPGHPFPATTKQMINLTNRLIKKYKFKKIFLATEEESYLKVFKEEFKDKLIYLKDIYRSNKNDAFKKYPRKNHRYKLGKDIILEMLLLSSSNYFVYVESNVSSAVMSLNINKKQKRLMINNGTNSKNQFLAQWLWYVKKMLPNNLGGFRNQTKI